MDAYPILGEEQAPLDLPSELPLDIPSELPLDIRSEELARGWMYGPSDAAEEAVEDAIVPQEIQREDQYDEVSELRSADVEPNETDGCKQPETHLGSKESASGV